MDSVNEKTFENGQVCLLVDNGSLHPDAILALRRVAEKLSERTGMETEAVGLLHSSKVGAGELEGVPGQTLESCLRRYSARGKTGFVVLPFFLGLSRGITDWLPRKLGELRNDFPELRVSSAPCLSVDGGEEILAEIVTQSVDRTVKSEGLDRPLVVFVDHGTPEPEVNAVREGVGVQVSDLLRGKISRLLTCAMERRPESEYDFNEPMLENLLLDESMVPDGDVVVALFFLSPGRHAGKNGDVEKTCERVKGIRPELRVHITQPFGEHPRLLDLLEQRLQDALDSC